MRLSLKSFKEKSVPRYLIFIFSSIVILIIVINAQIILIHKYITKHIIIYLARSASVVKEQLYSSLK